jgi:putative sterol carrier protein
VNAQEIIRKMPEAFNSAAARGTEAVVQYDISPPMYHVIQDGEMAAHEGRAEHPNVTLHISDDDLVGLMKGDLDPMSAFMSGRLKLEGDMMLAQKLVGLIDRSKLAEEAK